VLTRWVNVKTGGQTVQFKYTRFEDFQKLLATRTGEVEARDKGRTYLTQETDDRNLDYDLQKLAVLKKVNQLAITDLKQARLILGMYRAFLRAWEAAVKSARAFQGAHQALSDKLNTQGGPSASGNRWSSSSGNTSAVNTSAVGPTPPT
jgi:hypothetical protein